MFPSINSVAHYISEEEFKQQRLSSGAWVHYEDLVKKILDGDYDSITPLHIEVCVTYKCNFDCLWCSCRQSMSLCRNKHDLTINNIKKIIDTCHSYGIGIQWTGGEPLLNHSLMFAIKYASSLNVSQCLFTNGSLVDRELAQKIMCSTLSFVRVSLNCASPRIHSEFHGKIPISTSLKTILGIETLCEIKQNIKSKVKIGISIVVNSINVCDLVNTYKYILSLIERYPSAIDYIVVRPVNESIHDIENTLEGSFDQLYALANSSDELASISDKGVQVVFPYINECANSDCIKCRGCFLFSEISPNGDMFLCSDRYGDKNYKIGNILDDDFETIIHGTEMSDTRSRNKDCFKLGRCPRNSRGWYFNSLFDQIESFRSKNSMNDVIRWIEALKAVIPNEENSFFI